MTVHCDRCGRECEWSYAWTIRGLCPDCRSPVTDKKEDTDD